MPKELKLREIRVRILPDDAGVRDATVGELDADPIRAGDHVLVGDDGALRIDDHAGSEAALDPAPVVRPVAAEQLVEGFGLSLFGDEPRRVDIHHGRRRPRHRVGETVDDDGSRCCTIASPTTVARMSKPAMMRVFCNSSPQGSTIICV